MTIYWCQLLFLVPGTKSNKLWLNITEKDHEIGLQFTFDTEARPRSNCAGSAGNKATSYDQFGDSRICGRAISR